MLPQFAESRTPLTINESIILKDKTTPEILIMKPPKLLYVHQVCFMEYQAAWRITLLFFRCHSYITNSMKEQSNQKYQIYFNLGLREEIFDRLAVLAQL